MESELNYKAQALDYLRFTLGYYIEQYLDEGGLSWVYKVSKNDEEFAVKIIHKNKYCNNSCAF